MVYCDSIHREGNYFYLKFENLAINNKLNLNYELYD